MRIRFAAGKDCRYVSCAVALGDRKHIKNENQIDDTHRWRRRCWCSNSSCRCVHGRNCLVLVSANAAQTKRFASPRPQLRPHFPAMPELRRWNRNRIRKTKNGTENEKEAGTETETGNRNKVCVWECLCVCVPSQLDFICTFYFEYVRTTCQSDNTLRLVALARLRAREVAEWEGQHLALPASHNNRITAQRPEKTQIN